MLTVSGGAHRVVVSVVQPQETVSRQGLCHWLEARGRPHREAEAHPYGVGLAGGRELPRLMLWAGTPGLAGSREA